jgi:2-iminobutanoate/2-iminopropanoate deaminase
VSPQDRTVLPAPPELLSAIGAESSWSDAVCVGPFIWLAGQLGWDKATGEFADGIEAQAELALENVKSALGRVGATLRDVVSLRTYLVSHDDYHRYEPVYQRYFPQDPPVRVSIVVAENIHHALIDFEVMAVRRDI